VAAAPEPDPKAAELAAALREIRDRVRARYPVKDADLELPCLMPVLHARDTALGKVAAIGSINPRRPGIFNGLVQAVKRAVARLLEWHVREQVEFNRAVVAAIDATLEALNENNRTLLALAARDRELDKHIEELRASSADWRRTWEERLAAAESGLLRTIAELKGAFDFRVSAVSDDIQRRLWADLERVRKEYEALIHSELRLVRQRAALPQPAAAAGSPERAVPPPVSAAPALDWLQFAERFRGPATDVIAKQRFYLSYFRGVRDVIDLGCGRGEFLELMREAGVPARGVELSAELAELCRGRGLDVETADLLGYLPGVPPGSLGGIFCAHVVEHLPPERLPGLIAAAAPALRQGGVIAIETPNPECLAIFATHFYLDPTHVKPVPPGLLRFYLEEAGFGGIEVRRLSPAIDGSPSLASLPEDFRNEFFGGLDYAITARKL